MTKEARIRPPRRRRMRVDDAPDDSYTETRTLPLDTATPAGVAELEPGRR